jgi:hypothetical protein
LRYHPVDFVLLPVDGILRPADLVGAAGIAIAAVERGELRFQSLTPRIGRLRQRAGARDECDDGGRRFNDL